MRYSFCVFMKCVWEMGSTVIATAAMRYMTICINVYVFLRIFSCVSPAHQRNLLFSNPVCVVVIARCQVISRCRNFLLGCQLFEYNLNTKQTSKQTFYHVCSVASTILGGCFSYLAQLNTNARGCLACYHAQNLSVTSQLFSHNFVSLKYSSDELYHKKIPPIYISYHEFWF